MKKLLFLVLLLLLSLYGCGDVGNNTLGTGEVFIQTTTDSKSCEGCGCETYLVNGSNCKLKIKVKKIQFSDTNQSKYDKESIITYTVPAGERKFLGCSKRTPIDATIHSNECSLNFRWEIINKKKAEIIFPKTILLASANDSLNILSTVDTKEIGTTYQSNNCLYECSKNSIYCMSLTKQQIGQIHNSINELYKLILHNNGILLKKEVMRAFNQVLDPCNRSDIILSNGKFKNIGGKCIFSAFISIDNKNKEKVSINMPKKIEGKYSIGSDYYEVTFQDRTMAPIVTFDSTLEYDYGGVMHQILLNNQQIILGTETGCISIFFKEE